LERGDVDLLIIPSEFSSKAHPSEVILEEEFLAIVWSQGKLAKRKLTRREFAEASHVVAQPPGGATSLETLLFRRQDVARRHDVTTYSFTTLAPLVVGTDRIATVHGRLARQAEQTLPIRIVELPFKLPKMKQVAQWHKYRSQDAGLIWLRGLLREAAAE
jgi:DNA-binding transcriptional LysR family regulator